jgi:hypothetical protein
MYYVFAAEFRSRILAEVSSRNKQQKLEQAEVKRRSHFSLKKGMST